MISVLISILGIALFFHASIFRPFIFYGTLITMAVFGFVNGFVCSRLALFFKIGNWKILATLSALIYPSMMFICFGMQDIFDLVNKSSSATSILAALGYCLIWMVIDIPLTFIGAYIGYTHPLKIEPEVSEVKTEIPRQPWY